MSEQAQEATTSLLLNDEQEEDEHVSNLAEPMEVVAPSSNTHIVRRPILNKDMDVYAYDLLYGECGEGEDQGSSDSSQLMLNAFLDIGIDTIAEDHISIVKITRDFMEGKLPLPFPSCDVALELPDDAFKHGPCAAALESLATKGFMIAYRITEPGEDLAEYMEHIDLLKIDLEVWSREQMAELVPELLNRRVRLLATNVNTREELAYCEYLGLEHFHGRFISEPVIVSGSTLKPNRVALINILQILEDPDCDITALEELIVRDVTLSYKILRIINSAFYGFRRKIESVKQAVVSLGLKVIRDWFVVISLTDIEDKPQVLMFQCLQRARMLQLLTETVGLNKDTGFTIGLFSSIDAIMDQPMDVILQALPLSDEITEALLQREGTLGELLDIVIRYESGDWNYINSVGFEPSELSTYYFESMCWTRGLFEQIKSE